MTFVDEDGTTEVYIIVHPWILHAVKLILCFVLWHLPCNGKQASALENM